MVVSAMGHNTDVLVDLAEQITDQPPAREMDMLLSTGEQVSVALMAMAIHSLGHEAISLTGAQIGISTDSTHTKARIQSISTERMRQAAGRGQDRDRRRLSGHRRGFQHHHARPRRQRHDGRGPGGRAAGRRLRNLHRRRRRLHDRSAQSCPRPGSIDADQLRRDARAGQPGRGRDAQPLDRVRQEIRACRSTCAAASATSRAR